MSEQAELLDPIQDVNDFASNIMQWHDNKVSRLRHMMDIPEGVEVELEDGEPLTLDGLHRKAFRLGLIVALHELGQLPFAVEYETDD